MRWDTLLSLVVSICLCTFARAETFSIFDDFDRPDGPVGNGWLDLVDRTPMVIRDGEAASIDINFSSAGIYRSVPFTNPIRFQTRLKPGLDKFGGPTVFTGIFQVNSPSVGGTTGYGILIEGSRVLLYDNDQFVQQFQSPFQFQQAVDLDFVFSPNGSVRGTVSEGSNTFNVDFGPRPIQATGSYFSAQLGHNDVRSPLQWPAPRIDYLAVSDISAPSPLPRAIAEDFHPLIRPSPSAKRAIVLVHGFQDDPTSFTDVNSANSLTTTNMKQAIEDYLVLNNKSAEYDVFAFDWSEHADSALLFPAPATLEFASVQGQFLANELFRNGYDDHVHFIAHSLGGRVIDTAAQALAESGSWNGTIHQTFLDAYTPNNWEAWFGQHADWTEHYYNESDLLINTQDDFPNAFNVDVTNIIDEDGNFREDHKWPVRYYEQTVLDPASSLFGFGLSDEARELWPPVLQQGIEVSLPCDLGCQEATLSDPVLSNRLWHDPQSTLINASDEGTIAFDPTTVTLIAETDVWINMTVLVEEPSNFVEFDYEFVSASDGVLSVLVDGEPVATVYEQFSLDSQSTRLFTLEEPLAPGLHVLGFRLDAFGDVSSTVLVSQISTGLLVVPESDGIILALLGAVTLLLFCNSTLRTKVRGNPVENEK